MNNSILEMWHHILKEVELAKNYHRITNLDGSVTPRNPLLDYLLPSLFIIRLTTILDDALDQFINENRIPIQTKYRPDLNGRIHRLNDYGKLVNDEALHELRNMRNRLAHELVTQIRWNDLDLALDAVEIELQNFKYVGERPIYEYFAERSAAQESDEPNVIALFHYKYGIKSNGRVVMEISYTTKMYSDNGK